MSNSIVFSALYSICHSYRLIPPVDDVDVLVFFCDVEIVVDTMV